MDAATCADWPPLVPAAQRAQKASTSNRTGPWFRLGDAFLRVDADGCGFLDEFETRYRDCVVAQPSPGPPGLRCSAARLPGSSLLCMSFDGPDMPDPLCATGTPFRMLRHLASYAETPGPHAGWRMWVHRDDPRRFLLAGDQRRLVVDLDLAPPEFAIDCLVAVVQSLQPDVLFLHGASFGIAGAGALLLGCGKAGKSTTALALLARGHAVLGDDVAAIRMRSREVLPFRKTMSIRPGPPMQFLDARLRAVRHTVVGGDQGALRTLVSIGDLFPASTGSALPLRFAFVLDGFAESTALTQFEPSISDTRSLKAVVSESIPSWGLSAGRDLMRFLTVVNLLSDINCYRIKLGSPEASAAAIQDLMEAPCGST